MGSIVPGLMICVTIALAATFLSEHYGGPQFLYALLFGVSLNFLASSASARPGIEFASRTMLRLGVALLGARITLAQVQDTGWSTALLVVFALMATLAFGILLGRHLLGSTAIGVLTGGAVAICGASAAMALASVLPRHEETQRYTLLTVAVITLLSTLCMLIYPVLAHALGLDARATGIFLGATIHDVAQVVGAGYMISPEVGDVATVVKLMRVAMLLPVVALCALCLRQRGDDRRASPLAAMPWFLLAFAALVVLTSMEWVSPPVARTMQDASQWCLVVAIAALGTRTSVQQLAQVGWRPTAILVANTVFLVVLVGGMLTLA
ncbi:MAG: putative sulfate exporter family transporter [Pseudomonadota bacterium]|nr:putative sulfate exporter family transporter [Pseudomonadota bacterium]